MVRQFRWGSMNYRGNSYRHRQRRRRPVAAGLRELQEETGYAAKNGRLIGMHDLILPY